jgi:Nucleotidyl transferase AbiEii toxin, Type IV TA system
MPETFEPKTGMLPAAQQELWPSLAPAPRLSYVLYGGTAVALYLGHRVSVDFDFFRSEPLDKAELLAAFPFLKHAETIQDGINTLVVTVTMPSGRVKVSFFGSAMVGRISDPLLTADSILLVASREDLLGTKLKAILDRAEAKDYSDISALLANGVSLERGLGAFAALFKRDPALPLKAIGFFKDGDLPTLPKADQDRLRQARDKVTEVPKLQISNVSLAK